jgi:hypothetical protein
VALDSARLLIDEILSGNPIEPRYDAQVKMLDELGDLHFEEERSELFQKVRDTPLDLEELAAEMSARQKLLLSAADDAHADAP